MLAVRLTAMITPIVGFFALIYFLNIQPFIPLILHLAKTAADIQEG